MSLLDGTTDTSGGILNSPWLPLLTAATGFNAGMAPYMGYSRLPQSTSQAIAAGMGGMGQGLLQGAQTQLQGKLLGQEVHQRELANNMALWRMQMINNVLAKRGVQGPPVPGQSAGSLFGLPTNATTAPATANTPDAASGTGNLLAGGSVPSQGGNLLGTPDQAARQAPQASSQDVGGDVLGQAFEMDLMFPGAGKDIISKQFPGPSPSKVLLDEAARYPTGSAERELLVRNAYKNAGLQPENLRQGGAVYDPVTNRVLFQNPKLPEGAVLNSEGNGVSMLPGALPSISQSASADAIAKESAKLAAQKSLAGYNYGLEYGMAPPAGSAGMPAPNAGGAAPNTQAAGRTPAVTPAVTPAAPQRAPESARASQTPAEPIKTAQDTVIPPISQAAPVINSGTYLKERQKQWAETENEWGKAQGPSQVAEQRVMAIMDALKQTEGGTFATDKAAIKAGLHAVGIDLPENVWGNPAQVQIALKDNFAAALETMKSASSRFTQRELLESQKNFAHPDLQPAASQAIGAQVVGMLRWDRAMRQDWSQAKQAGWKDPQDFERAWQQANPLQSFINQASKDIGPLKGMATAVPSSLQNIKGLQRSPSTGLFRDPATGKIYNSDGSPH